MKKRVKNPFFWVGVSGLVWQLILQHNIPIEKEQFQLACDLVSYLFLGVGLYSSFEEREEADK